MSRAIDAGRAKDARGSGGSGPPVSRWATVRRLARHEVAESLRNYWFAVNSVAFLVGGLLLMLFGERDAMLLGSRGFARALAGLMQLALFIVPLMALFPASATVAAEREVGTLPYLLAQPVTTGEVFAGKWVGVAVAVLLSLLFGFGATGAVAAGRGVGGGLLLALIGLTLLLALAFVSIGLALSAASPTRGRAVSLALTAWLLALALGSLGLMGAFVAWGLPAEVLQVWAFVNPIEAFRLGMMALLDPGVQVLGPVGTALLEGLGRAGVVTLAITSLLTWTAGATLLGRRALAASLR